MESINLRQLKFLIRDVCFDLFGVDELGTAGVNSPSLFEMAGTEWEVIGRDTVSDGRIEDKSEVELEIP